MNSFDSAVAKRLGQYITAEIDRCVNGLAGGSAADFTEYQKRVAAITAYRDVLNMLTEIEQELKQ